MTIDDMMDKELEMMKTFEDPMTLLEEIEWLERDIEFSEKSIVEMQAMPRVNNGDMSLGFAIINLEATKRRLCKLKQIH